MNSDLVDLDDSRQECVPVIVLLLCTLIPVWKFLPSDAKLHAGGGVYGFYSSIAIAVGLRAHINGWCGLYNWMVFLVQIWLSRARGSLRALRLPGGTFFVHFLPSVTCCGALDEFTSSITSATASDVDASLTSYPPDLWFVPYP